MKTLEQRVEIIKRGVTYRARKYARLGLTTNPYDGRRGDNSVITLGRGMAEMFDDVYEEAICQRLLQSISNLTREELIGVVYAMGKANHKSFVDIVLSLHKVNEGGER